MARKFNPTFTTGNYGPDKAQRVFLERKWREQDAQARAEDQEILKSSNDRILKAKAVIDILSNQAESDPRLMQDNRHGTKIDNAVKAFEQEVERVQTQRMDMYAQRLQQFAENPIAQQRYQGEVNQFMGQLEEAARVVSNQAGKMRTEAPGFEGYVGSTEESYTEPYTEEEAKEPEGPGRGFPQKVDLKAKFGEDFVLPKDRSEDQLLNDIANLTALNMAKPGEESAGFSQDVLGGLAYDYELELDALMEEAHSRGFNLHALDDEASERLEKWRTKKKKFSAGKNTPQN